MDKLKVLDLFAGIGGFSLGLHNTGLYKTVAFCEWDEKAKAVLNKNFPGIFCYTDISYLTYKDGYLYSEKDEVSGFTDIDVITGGFPCQDISQAGKKAGLDGERSRHWFEYLRLIDQIKPKGVIIENVSALRSRGLETILKGLNEIGYDAEWHCITASSTGAPHERERLFILAYPSCIGQQGSWECFKSVHPTPNEYREASGLVDAFQRKDLPFVCRRHDGVSKEVDRIKQLGNSVCPPIVSQLGVHLHSNLKRMGLINGS